MINIKIKISIAGKKIFFKYCNENTNNKNSINNNSELIFDRGYFLGNKNIICNIINGIVTDKDINSITVLDYELIPDVIDVVNCIKKITTINIPEDKEINFEIYERLLKCKNIKNVNCYNAPIYMLDNLDKKNIKVNFRIDYLSDSHFIIKNRLFSYSRMYYKETINFDKLMSEEDINDLKMFLEINNHLKIVNIYNFSFDLIKQVINELGKNAKGNIQIIIRANSENAEYIQEAIPFFKTLDKLYKRKLNLKFKIKYSFEYKKKNILKQMSNNVLLVSCIIISLVSVFSFALIEYNNFITKQQEDELKEITNVGIENQEPSDTEESNNTPSDEVQEENTETNGDNSNVNTNTNTNNNGTTTSFTEDYQKLLSINNETVGWLKVNNTRVDYPVVKANNNDYYLNHNFYKQSNFNGWVYMDYRNNTNNLDQNTIIYGHNLKNGMMFGSLNNVKNSSWYNNPDNLLITFNTTTKQMKWQIFSIYVINVTNDYLYANFEYDSQFKEFVDKIKSRSIKDFGIEVSKFDKILTLSTCQNNSKQRLVVHAKLIN